MYPYHVDVCTRKVSAQWLLHERTSYTLGPCQVVRGDCLTSTAACTTWCRVIYKQRTAYVSKRYVTNPSPCASSKATAARRYGCCRGRVKARCRNLADSHRAGIVTSHKVDLCGDRCVCEVDVLDGMRCLQVVGACVRLTCCAVCAVCRWPVRV